MNRVRRSSERAISFSFTVSPTTTTTTTDLRHSHFNRLSTSINQSVVSQLANTDEDEDDDSESASTQSTQPISLTSFIQTTNPDLNAPAQSSARQMRQRLNTNENDRALQRRTRYTRRATGSNRDEDEEYSDRRGPSTNGSTRAPLASDDDDEDNDQNDDEDNEISSNSKRNRIERSDRRISSIQRPNYKIDSDEHEEDDPAESRKQTNDTSTVEDHPHPMETTDKANEKVKGTNLSFSGRLNFVFSFQGKVMMTTTNRQFLMTTKRKMKKMRNSMSYLCLGRPTMREIRIRITN